LKRLISALCILPPLVLIVHFGSSLHFLLLLTCVVGLGLLEFYRMLAAKGFPCWRWLGVAVGTLLPVAFYAEGITHQAIVHQAAVATIVVLLFVVGLFTRRELAASVQSIAFTLLGVFYVGWLLGYVVLLRMLSDGPSYVFYIFGVVWLGDAAALVSGTLMGRHKLAPAISPHKTIEGAVGGILGSLGGAILGGLWLLGNFTLAHCLAVGIMLAVFGQLGDLSESLLKRGTGIKDSAMLIPGHGGILDKVDGILFGAPALYYYVLYIIGQELPSATNTVM
jgi:phosphatidate cytidylyltransferase